MGCLWKVQERVRGGRFAVKNGKKIVDRVLKFGGNHITNTEPTAAPRIPFSSLSICSS